MSPTYFELTPAYSYLDDQEANVALLQKILGRAGYRNLGVHARSTRRAQIMGRMAAGPSCSIFTCLISMASRCSNN